MQLSCGGNSSDSAEDTICPKCGLVYADSQNYGSAVLDATNGLI